MISLPHLLVMVYLREAITLSFFLFFFQISEMLQKYLINMKFRMETLHSTQAPVCMLFFVSAFFMSKLLVIL